MRGLLRRVSSPSSSGKYSPHGLSESLPAGPLPTERPPSESALQVGPRRRPSVDLGHYDPATLSSRGALKQLNPLQEDRDTVMSFPGAQSATAASAAPKRRSVTPASAIVRVRCDAGTVVWPNAATPQRTRCGVAHRPTPPQLPYAVRECFLIFFCGCISPRKNHGCPAASLRAGSNRKHMFDETYVLMIFPTYISSSFESNRNICFSLRKTFDPRRWGFRHLYILHSVTVATDSRGQDIC